MSADIVPVTCGDLPHLSGRSTALSNGPSRCRRRVGGGSLSTCDAQLAAMSGRSGVGVWICSAQRVTACPESVEVVVGEGESSRGCVVVLAEQSGRGYFIVVAFGRGVVGPQPAAMRSPEADPQLQRRVRQAVGVQVDAPTGRGAELESVVGAAHGQGLRAGGGGVVRGRGWCRLRGRPAMPPSSSVG